MMYSELFHGYTFQVILENSAILGIAAGVLGVFIMTKKNSLLMGATSHAVLTGILLSVAITGARNSSVMLMAAAVMGLLSIITIKIISDITKIDKFMLQSLGASVYFGACMVLFAYLQKEMDAVTAGLEKFLFGEAATLLKSEVDISIYVCGGVIFTSFLFLRRFKAIMFNQDLARTTRIPTAFYNVLLTLMTIAVTVVGIQTVGILLMGTLFIAPAAAARLWLGTFVPMTILAGLIGGISGMAGGLISATVRNISTGPAIIGVAGLVLFISALAAPKKGLLWRKKNKYFYAPLEDKNK